MSAHRKRRSPAYVNAHMVHRSIRSLPSICLTRVVALGVLLPVGATKNSMLRIGYRSGLARVPLGVGFARCPHQFVFWGAVYRGNAVQRASSSSSVAGPEVLTIDEIEVEIEDSWAAAPLAPGPSSTTLDAAPVVDVAQEDHVTDVTTIDTFSKSRVLNYLKRAAQERRWAFDSAGVFECEPAGADGLVRCRVRLPCPPPHGVKIGEGQAANPKDAELLCAMHAERVLDALGIPLYVLPSMQQKHAESVRRTGRWAPLPGDHVLPAETSLPPPLRMLGLHDLGTPPCRAESASASVAEAASSPSVAAASGVFFKDYYTYATEAHDNAQRQAESAADAAAAAMYETMEGRAFQPCNLLSTRFSHSDVAITLPLIYDKNARGRLNAYLRFIGLAEMERAARVTHVPVQGASFRMHLVELKLTADGALVARGKALEKQHAFDLAAMHAELLLDYYGIVLFPDDPEKQRSHAAVAIGCGRWAPMFTGDVPPCTSPHLAPQPIKQLICAAGDVEGLQLLGRGAFSQRHFTERIMLVHNEIGIQWNTTFVEAQPDPSLCTEARGIVTEWLRAAGCKYPELFVCTRMGDFVRATIVLALPPEYGVRGGNSIGRTVAQAIDLACLHALDVLCALGIRVFRCPKQQAEFVARRRHLGLVVPTDDETPQDPSTCRVPPGYLAEGAVRPLPRHEDIMHCLGLEETDYRVPPCTSLESLIEDGNKQKPHVQAYLRRVTGADLQPVIVQTGSAASVRNIVFLPLPLPAARFGSDGRVIAVGYALKKKDAERMCFMHAWEVLEANGVPIGQQRDLELREQREKKKKLKTTQPPSSQIGDVGEPPQQQEEPLEGVERKLPVTTPPWMHPALGQHIKREAEALAAKRARPKLFSDRD